jgi:hypothetical protein
MPMSSFYQTYPPSMTFPIASAASFISWGISGIMLMQIRFAGVQSELSYMEHIMDDIKFPARFYVVGIAMNLVRHIYLTIPSIVLLILGAFGIPYCLLVGSALLVLVLVIAIIDQVLITYVAKTSTNQEYRDSLNDLLHNQGVGLLNLIDERMECRNLSHEELMALNDEELVHAVVERIDARHDNPIYGAGHDDGMSVLERTARAVYYFDLEYQNGGLCQYFANSSRTTAPCLEEALRVVGAEMCADIYQKFLSVNNIDPNDLDRFRCDKVEDYATKTKQYPFDEVDSLLQKGFAEEDPIRKLATYVRARLDELEPSAEPTIPA